MTVPTAPAVPAPIERLLQLMHHRLALMHDVARWKWIEKKSISDPVRERELLDKVAERGRGRGMDPAFTRSFFAAQIDAAKLVQQADFDQWSTEGQGPATAGADLATLRDRIDRLNDEIIDALAEIGPIPISGPMKEAVERRARELLDGIGMDAALRATAIRPLL